MIWGNHDFVGERTMEEGVSQLEFIFGENSNIYILNDELKEIDGVKFYGTPWCPNLYNWAFYKPSLELTETFNKIPEDTNILLTHCPPRYGQQGIVLQEGWNQYRNFGCSELQEAIICKFGNKEEDTYVFSGHIHSGNHDFEIMNNVYYRNVSIKDEEYHPIYNPFYFDYEKES
jgi:Icc-related predicted phosphoesterase